MFSTHQRANESTEGIHRCTVSHAGEISQTHHPSRFSIYIGEISHERKKKTTLKITNPNFPKILEVPEAMQTHKDISNLTTSHSLKHFALLPSYQFWYLQASSQNHSMWQTSEHHSLSSACAAELNSSVSRERADFLNPFLILKIPSYEQWRKTIFLPHLLGLWSPIQYLHRKQAWQYLSSLVSKMLLMRNSATQGAGHKRSVHP